MISDEKSADILFEIQESDDKSELTKIHAPRHILQVCATTLADMCEGGYGKMTPVPITDTKPRNFRVLLRHVYVGENYHTSFSRIIPKKSLILLMEAFRSTQIFILCRHKEIYSPKGEGDGFFN